MRRLNGNFTIDRVYYLNTSERVNKHHAQQIVNALAGVPENRLKRFESRLSINECPDTIAEVAELMVADGFEEWRYYLDNDIDGTPGWLAADWTKLSVLREIISKGENAVVLSDQVFWWNITFKTLEKKIKRLPGLKVLNLDGWYDPADNFAMDYMSKLEPSGSPGIYKNFKGQGASAQFFTYEGAVEHLEMWRQRPDTHAVRLILRQSRKEDLEGYYVCIPPLVRSLNELEEHYTFIKTDKDLRPPKEEQ